MKFRLIERRYTDKHIYTIEKLKENPPSFNKTDYVVIVELYDYSTAMLVLTGAFISIITFLVKNENAMFYIFEYIVVVLLVALFMTKKDIEEEKRIFNIDSENKEGGE